jgi:hypothetical protein
MVYFECLAANRLTIIVHECVVVVEGAGDTHQGQKLAIG